jgi:hypothetical protein
MAQQVDVKCYVCNMVAGRLYSVIFGYTGRVVCRVQPVGVVWANNPASTGIRTKDINATPIRDT